MSTSVVIPHYGPEALVRACLAALWAHTDMPVEVVVVDNGTAVDDVDVDVLVLNLENLGFAKACNQGAQASTGDILVFLNNDTEVRDGWLEPLVGAIADGAAIAGGLLLYPGGGVQHAGVRLYWAGGVLTAENRRQHYGAGPVDAVTGACMAVKRSVFEELGGFDEGFANGYEDVDLCLAARAAGHGVVYVPSSVVTHHESSSGPERWRAVRQNIARLQDKWAGPPVAAR